MKDQQTLVFIIVITQLSAYNTGSFARCVFRIGNTFQIMEMNTFCNSLFQPPTRS